MNKGEKLSEIKNESGEQENITIIESLPDPVLYADGLCNDTNILQFIQTQEMERL